MLSQSRPETGTRQMTTAAVPSTLAALPAANGAEGASYDADVIVVGAGPGGSSAAYWLANAGLDVLLLEKSTFPREKVCGDGLTPRAVKQLVGMGIALEPADGWLATKGI